MSSYDMTEATEVFARRRSEREPGLDYEDRTAALSALLDAVLKVAKDTGHEVDPPRPIACITHRRKGSVYLAIREGVLLLSTDPHSIVSYAPHIDYDPISKLYTGRDDDTSLMPIPGGPRKRQSAVAVVAEVVTDLIDKREPKKAKQIK